MKISGLYEVYFSPTGHTKKVIELFSKAWNVPKTKVDLTNMNNEFDKYDIYSDDLCVFAVPSYCGRVPVTATQRIKQMQGNNTPAIIISTYGNRDYEDTLCELQDIVEERGFYVVAALAVPTQHSIVNEVAKGRIDEQDIEKLTAMAIAIREYIAIKDGFNFAKLKGNEVYRELKEMDLKPIVQGKCLNCGICARNCPVGAIPLDNTKETDESKCISCMRCVTYCPSKSRIMPKIKLSPIVNKLKKECGERKEIEIFINNNTGNKISAKEARDMQKIKKEEVELTQTQQKDIVAEESVLPQTLQMPELDNILPEMPEMPQLENIVEEVKKTEEIKKNSDFGAFDDLVFDPLPETNKVNGIKNTFEETEEEIITSNSSTSITNDIPDIVFDEPEFEINGAPIDEGPVKIEIPQDKILPPPPVEEPVLEKIEEPVLEAIEEPVLENIEEPVLEAIEEPVLENIEEPMLEPIEELEPILEFEPILEVEQKQIKEQIIEPVDKAEEIVEEKTSFEFKMGDLVSLVNNAEEGINENNVKIPETKEEIKVEIKVEDSVQMENRVKENISINQMNLEEMMQLQEIEPPKSVEDDKKVDINSLESAADSLFDF